MKWYLGWMVKLHYRRVYKAGIKEIPDGKPAIFASNHPAGFIEPIILATNVRQAIHFLVLGSFLTSKWLQWFFRGVKMVPIYRRDITGNQTIEKNRSTFQFVNETLKRNAHILIYPEAKTNFIYKIRPLRKGIVRMSRDFLIDQPGREMYIVPVAVNFIWPSRFRSDVFMQVGKPIKLDAAEGNEQKWYNNKLDIISAQMRKLMFDVEDEKRHQAVQHLVQTYHNQIFNKPELFYKVNVCDEEHVREIRNMVSRIDKMPSDTYNSLKSLLDEYLANLEKYGLRDIVVNNHFRIGLLAILLLICGFPFFVLGAILNGISLLAGYLAKKIMVKRIEYKAGVSAAIPAVFTILLFLVSIFFGIFIHWGFFILAFALPLSLYLFVYYFDLLNVSILYLKWRILSNATRSALLAMKNKILEVIN